MVSSLVNMEPNAVSTHQLQDRWVLWAHLPHDTDWSVNSYKQICILESVEQAIVLYETLPEKMIRNCMLFLMREGIKPTWEDTKNRYGGCFSYKVNNKVVHKTWKNLSYSLVGETLSKENRARKSINGITISPKKNFCIVKIWFATCEFQSPNIIIDLDGLTSQGCLFKKHLPEY